MPNDIFAMLDPDRTAPDLQTADAVRFDLAMPDTASDGELKAAARRISTGLFGVPDPDGRVWNPDRQPFATGAEYFRHMRTVAENGVSEAMTPELRTFETADEAQQLKLAREALSAGDSTAESAVRLAQRARPVPTADELADAPEDIRAAASRMSADAGALRAVTQQQRDADLAALAAWRERKDDLRLVSDHRAKLMADNAWAQFMAVKPALSGAAQDLAQDIVRNRRLPATRLSEFDALPEDERRALAKLSGLTRARVPGGFWNTLGDAGIGFLNSAIETPVNASLQAGRLIEVADPDDINRRARDEQILKEAVGETALFDQISGEHGYLARSFIGAVSTLPYMGYASIPYAGPAIVALDAMQRFEDRVAADGGDITGKDWLATKLVFGSMYAAVERMQALPVMRDKGPLAVQLAFVRAFSKRGAGAASAVAAHIGKTTLEETLEDSVQQGMEEAAVSLGLGRDAWEPAVRGAASDFVEAAGSMGLVSLAGAARQGHRARTKGGAALTEYAAAALRREGLLAAENPSATPEGALAQAQESVRRIAAFRRTWTSGGKSAEALAAAGVDTHRAAMLHAVFEGEEQGDRANREIEARNLTERQFDREMDVDEETAGIIVANHGADAEAELERRSFTPAGARLVADYFRSGQERKARETELLQALDAEQSAKWAVGEKERTETAGRTFEELAPLRAIWSKAQTRDGAVKAFAESGFSAGNAEALADAFENEHALATSPQAAAAFRALYVEGSRVESARELARRMLPGYEVQDAPDAGPNAFRLAGKNANSGFSFIVETGADLSSGVDSEAYAASVEQATQGRVTATQWLAMDPATRRMEIDRNGLRTLGDFQITDETDPSAHADSAGGRVLTGRVKLADAARGAVQFHEIAHGWVALMRRTGRLTDADIARLRAKYGAPRTSAEAFNEEAFADDLREWLAAESNPPEKSHLARFFDAVRGMLSQAAASDAGRRSAADAREALFQSIAYGVEFGGVGELAPVARQPDSAAAGGKPQARVPATVDPRFATPVEDSSARREVAVMLRHDRIRDAHPELYAKALAKTDGNHEAAGKLAEEWLSDAASARRTPAASPERPASKAPAPGGKVPWTASTPQGNVKAGGHWKVVPLAELVTSDMDGYDQTLQQRTRGASAASSEQVASIVSAFDASRLFDAPETSNGAPIVTLQGQVLSGNGRTTALRSLASEHRFDEYRNPMREFAASLGVDVPAGVKDPVLVRVVNNLPVGVTLQKLAALSNRESVLRMSDSEQSGADAELIEGAGTAGLYQANADGLPSRRGNDEFFRWFAGATGDASVMDSAGGITEAGRLRARRAMLALAIGRGKAGKDTVRAFTENYAELGLGEQAEALLMSAGALAAVENAKPQYGLAQETSAAAAAMLALARQRKAGKTVSAEEHLAQGDLLQQTDAATQQLVRLFDSGRPAEGIAAALRRYADLAANIDTATPDMFGEPDTPKDALLRKASDDTDVKAAPGIRYSVALLARRYALSVDIPAEGERLVAAQLEFLFTRQFDPAYRQKMEEASRKRKATLAAKERARIEGVREAAAAALANPDDPDAWRAAFEAGDGTVSRVVWQFFENTNGARHRFGQTYDARQLVGLKINSSADAAALLMPLRNPYQESTKVLWLNSRDRVIGADVVGIGLLNMTLTNPREVFTHGIRRGAKKFIFAHNHPSGDPNPSKEDQTITERLTQAGQILGIEYVDHIVTNGAKYYSFRDASIKTFDGQQADWEAIPAGDGEQIRAPDQAARYANTLRQSAPSCVHAIMLDTQRRITAVSRIPFNPEDLKDTRNFAASVTAAAGHTAVSHPTQSILLDLTANEISVKAAMEIHSAVSAQMRVISIQLDDSIYQDNGQAHSVTGSSLGGIMPLSSEAAGAVAENPGGAQEGDSVDYAHPGKTSGARYSLAASPHAALGKVLAMEPVGELDGNEFADDGSGKKLVDRVTDHYLAAYGGKVFRPEIGEVLLDRRGVKNSVSHKFGKEKKAAFAAVPDVVRFGEIYGREQNWKGRRYDSVSIIAPIRIAGKDYLCDVIVTIGEKGPRFYLHEVEEKEKLGNAFKTGLKAGAPQASRLMIAKRIGAVNQAPSDAQSPETGTVRYSVDTRGVRYSREALLSGFVAHAVMTRDPVPSKSTIERMALQIGMENWSYADIVKAGKELADTSVNRAIRDAAGRAGTDNAAFAIGELAREAHARELVRGGAREGERLARNAATIGKLTEDGVRAAMRAQTGADYSSIERDTGFDIAKSILSADPAQFQQGEEKPAEPARAEDAASSPDGASEQQEAAASENENDPDAHGLTDRQRYEIVKRNREREERARALIEAALRRGSAIRNRAEEQRNRAAAEEPGTEPATSGGAAATTARQDTPDPSAPQASEVREFQDKWDFAAFLRVWAYEQWRRLNPSAAKSEEGLSKNRVANEFYRKTAVNELTALARRLIEPGFPRENIMRHIGEIEQGLSAAQIERRSAHVFGMINAQAVRTEKAKLIEETKRDIKRRFIKGKEFDELGADVDRKLRGQIEEDARWIMKVCELSAESVREGKASPLDETRANLNEIIRGRLGLTGPDGEPLPAGESDMELSRALRRLALLDSYGGMVDMMPGEILDLKEEIMQSLERDAADLQERWQAAYDKIKSIKEPIVSAVMREPDAPASEPGALGRFVDSLTGMLRLRLDFLTRWADADRRDAARTAIDSFMRELADGNTAYALALRDDQAKLNAALGRIFTREDGRPDLRAVRTWLRRLDETIPQELASQLTRQGRQRTMTYGQMLQLLVSIEQPSYAGNVEKHERQGQSALIRTWRGVDGNGKALAAFTPQDEAFVEWLRRDFYARKRDALSEVMRRLAGRDVKSPDPLYCPVKMQLTRTTPLHMDSGRWEPIAKVFSRRVKNKLDFDETAGVLDIFQNRSRETALLTAYSERGIVLRSVLTDAALQQAVVRFHGKAQLKTILQQVEQALNGGREKDKSERELAAASLAMRATAWMGLGYNIGSAMKQATSIPVFANKIGFRRLLSIMGTAPDQEVMRRMRASDEFRARYGTAPGSGMDIASRQAYEGYDDPARGAMQRFFGDWGLAPMRIVDARVSLWIGQGVYRDLYAANIDSGMDAAEADRRAMSDTWSMVEETQQSGRTENLTSLTRNHGQVGKMLTMFATSPLQQMQYELSAMREWADLRANGGSPEAVREAGSRAVRAFVINHVIVPAAMAAVTALFKAATGEEPDWKKENYAWTLLVAALMGQFSRIFFVGAMTEQTLRALFLRESPRMGQLIPAEGVIRTAGNLAFGVRDVATWSTDKFETDFKRILKSSAVTRIPMDAYENYFGEGSGNK